MSRADTWMPLYVADYLRDTTHLSAEEHGGYLLLLMGCWTRGGTLPAEDAKLAAIARMTPAAWKRSRSTIMEFFTRDGDGWTHRRVAAELKRASDLSEKRRNAGAKGGEAKAQKAGKPLANAKQDTEQKATPTRVAPPSPSPILTDGSDATASAHEGDGADPDAQAWALAVALLTRRAGLSERQARAFFGGLLKRQSVRASELYVALVHAEEAGTPDLQPYLTAAAQNLKTPRLAYDRDASREARRDADLADGLSAVSAASASAAGSWRP